LHYSSTHSQHIWISQANNILNIVHTQFNVKLLPHFSPLIDFNFIDAILVCFYRSDFIFSNFFFLIIIFLAILVCLEHSFWHQGSSPSKGFTEAFNVYLKDKHALLDQKLKAYLMSKKSNDWFTMKFCPSHDECAELRNIVLDNLLRKTSSCLLSLVLLIQSLQPILNPPFDAGSCRIVGCF